MKECIIIIIIISTIISADIITKDYVRKNVSIIEGKLNELEEILNNDVNNESAKKKIEEIITSWEEKKDKLSIIIDHNNIEKIEIKIIKIKTGLYKGEEYNLIQLINEAKIIISGMYERNELKVKNIF